MAIAGMQMEMPSAGPNLIKKTPGFMNTFDDSQILYKSYGI
jgi:hypothetical protein